MTGLSSASMRRASSPWTITPLGSARRSPRSHRLHEAAAEEPHDVDLVRRLAEEDAAAAHRIELLGAPRPIEEIGEVERGDHAHAPQLAARGDLARTRDRRVEAVAMADDD